MDLSPERLVGRVELSYQSTSYLNKFLNRLVTVPIASTLLRGPQGRQLIPNGPEKPRLFIQNPRHRPVAASAVGVPGGGTEPCLFQPLVEFMCALLGREDLMSSQQAPGLPCGPSAQSTAVKVLWWSLWLVSRLCRQYLDS